MGLLVVNWLREVVAIILTTIVGGGGGGALSSVSALPGVVSARGLFLLDLGCFLALALTLTRADRD